MNQYYVTDTLLSHDASQVIFNIRSALNDRSAEQDVAGITARMCTTVANSGNVMTTKSFTINSSNFSHLFLAGRISPMWEEVLAERVEMKICTAVDLQDVISGILMLLGSKFALSHWLCTWALPLALPVIYRFYNEHGPSIDCNVLTSCYGIGGLQFPLIANNNNVYCMLTTAARLSCTNPVVSGKFTLRISFIHHTNGSTIYNKIHRRKTIWTK